MRTCTFIIGILLFAFSASAQFQKEHTWDGSVQYHQVGQEGGYYIKAEGQTVRLYNLDYSLHRTVDLPFIDKEVQNVSYVSKNLFKKDRYIEFMAYYRDTVRQETSLLIMQANGDNRIDNLGYRYGRVINAGGDYKLLVSNFNGETAVYDLPGSLESTGRPVEKDEQGGNVFPNPANKMVTVDYDLPSNKTGRVSLYNMQGQQVGQKRIGPAFEQVRFRVGDKKPGTYTAVIKSQGSIRDQQQVVIQ